jgi:hypothetical protein
MNKLILNFSNQLQESGSNPEEAAAAADRYMKESFTFFPCKNEYGACVMYQ